MKIVNRSSYPIVVARDHRENNDSPPEIVGPLIALDCGQSSHWGFAEGERYIVDEENGQFEHTVPESGAPISLAIGEDVIAIFRDCDILRLEASVEQK